MIPFQINPHFVPGELIAHHHGETREQRIQQFHTEHKIPVIRPRENGRLEIHGTSFEPRGEGSVEWFEAGKEPKMLAPEAS